MSTDNDLMPDSMTEAFARSAEHMTDDAHARVRHIVMSSIRHDSRAHYFATISHRVAAAAAAIGVVSAGVAYAADSALPGQALYEIKRGAEDALVAILPPGALENSVLVDVAGRRAEEAANLARSGAADDLINDAIDEVRAAVIQAESAAGPLSGEETTRIEQRAQEAPVQTREAISSAIKAPDSAPSGGTRPGGGSETPGSADPGTGSGSQGKPDAPVQSGDTTGGAGAR